MNNTISLRRRSLLIGIPLLIIGIMIGIAKTSLFSMQPNNLAIGITFDLLIVLPLIYFLLIRKTSIPNTTVAPILIIGLVTCTLLLPTENQYYLNLFKTWVFPFVEISIVSFVFYKLRKARKLFKQQQTLSQDFYTVLKTAFEEVFPKRVVVTLATEIAVIYYGFINWKKHNLKENEFSYHKDNSSTSLLVAFLFVITIETVALHFLLTRWSGTAAWILTIISIYSGVQVLGFLKSMFKRPIVIENDTLILKYGIMNESTIEISNIDSIELSTKDIELNEETRQLSFLGPLEQHNIILHLKEENTLIGLYGIKRTYKTLAFHVDDKKEFINQLQHQIIQ